MPIPSEITTLVNQLNEEFNQTEQEATEGVNLATALLSRFPNNVRVIQFFAFFNNALLFTEISRRRMQAIVERISVPDVTVEEIQEAGQDLGTLLGRVLETKIAGRQIVMILEEL